ncbi:G-patch domain and KOW motifs-containing protein [Stigmatopora nigra]
MASNGGASPGGHADEKKSGGSVSFGFAKTFSKFKGPTGDAVAEQEDVDYLTGIARNQLQSTKPSEAPTERVIPVILKNRWRVPERADTDLGKNGQRLNGDGGDHDEDRQDSMEALAVKELIEDSRKKLEERRPGDDLAAIPLLAQNKTPDGFEDGERLNVELRPQPSTEDDYERVPVEGYGMAMLKGMGWKKGEGIGRTFKQDVKPYEYKPRVMGLGLGADRSAAADLEPKKRRRPPKPGEERQEDDDDDEPGSVLARGVRVFLESGVHKERYGMIEALDTDNARVLVKLAIGGQVASIHQYAVRTVGRKEYERNAKDLSRLSKAHKNKVKEERRPLAEPQDDGKRKRPQEREKTVEKEDKRVKTAPRWLQRDLRVRFVDRHFKGGRYYNAKMRVEDVVTPRTCICRTDEGRLIDDVTQEMLETIVPKSEGDAIMVVLGEHRGQVGRILRRDKNACRATVQLDRHQNKLFTLDYDFICHYLGGADHC